MDRLLSFIKYYSISKLTKRKREYQNIRNYLRDKEILPGNRVLSSNEANQLIYDMIISGKPFMAGRFGATELNAIKTFDFKLESKYADATKQMVNWSGFFPEDFSLMNRFKNLMIREISECDVMGVWALPFEKYYLKKYGNKNLKMTYLLDLEPWSSSTPWSAALKDKKVLVIHPFVETIKKQYEVRGNIFPGTDILPEFTLKTLKAVQTIAGQRDERFDTWFEALDWMYNEAIKIDFDVAIIGCGAYGFPLAARLKKAGKQTIHLAGATQILFGIKGKRWSEGDAFDYVQKFFNDFWIYPTASDKPQKANNVEGGCYW